MKKIDDLKKVLETTAQYCKRLGGEAKRHADNEKTFGETLAFFPARDKDLPIPYQVPEESGFVLGMQKFSDIFIDLSSLENSFATECDTFVTKINEFIGEYLDKTRGQLKTKIKNYELTRQEYDKILQKIQKIQKDPKRVSVVKLYEAEKERAKFYTQYDKALFEMEAHCDDLDDLLNTKLLEECVNFYNAQKNMFGWSYGYLDDIKQYLLNLKEWCKEEAKVCEEHKAEREAQREQLHKEETAFTKHQFALLFYSTPNLLPIINNVANEKQVDPSCLVASFLALFKEAGFQPPEGLNQFVKASNNTEKSPEKPAIDVRLFIKENFEEIGMKLLEDPVNRELLISLGGALASLEQLTSGRARTEKTATEGALQ